MGILCGQIFRNVNGIGNCQQKGMCKTNEYSRLRQTNAKLSLQSSNNVLGFRTFLDLNEQLFDLVHLELLRLTSRNSGNLTKDLEDLCHREWLGLGHGKSQGTLLGFEGLRNCSQITLGFVFLLDHS